MAPWNADDFKKKGAKSHPGKSAEIANAILKVIKAYEA